MKAGAYKTAFLGSDYPFHYIDDKSKATKAIKTLLSHQGTLSIDTETEALPAYKYDKMAGLNPYLSRVRLLQIFTGEEAYIFDIKKIAKDELFLQFLSVKNFIGHNSVFDIQYFINQFKVVDMSIGCTMLAAKLLFHALFPSDAGLSASLRNLVNVTFGAELLKEMQVSDWSEPELTFEQVEYSALDVISTYFLAKRLAPKLKKYGLTRVYNLYKDAQVPIARLQLNGIKLDVDAHRDNIVTWRAELYKAKKDLLKLTGIEHVTAAQIGSYLESTLPYNVLSIWPKTETGKLQTDSHVFADFDWLDIVKPLAEYKKKEKLCTSFGHTLINMINPVTKRLHAQYKLAGARTGRLSCSNPNNQQMPHDKKFRSLFMPEPGRIFLCADYSQIEIRVAAEISRDKAMLHAYRNGIDLHAQTASAIAKKPIEKVTKEERQMAKACFSADTEILTKEGWIRFDKLKGNESVAQVTFPVSFGSKCTKEAPLIEFVVPLFIGKLTNKEVIHLKDRNTDAIMTPNHEVVYQNKYNELRKKHLKDIGLGELAYIPSSGNLKEADKAIKLSSNFSRLLAAIHGDGCLKSFYLQFQFKKERKIKRCRKLLKDNKLDFTESKTCGYVIFYVRNIREEVLQYISIDKTFNWNLLHILDREAFLDELQYWDGFKSVYGERNRIRITSVNNSALDFIQAVACCTGKQSTINYVGKTGYSQKDKWEISYRLKGHAYNNVKSIKRKVLKPVDVYCAQVPSGNILVRRNNKPMISGNCNFGILFGIGATKFSHYAKKSYKVEVDVEEAAEWINAFRETYSGYRTWQVEQTSQAKESLLTVTPCGKMRRLSEDNYFGSSLSTPVQGGASECMLHALIRLNKKLTEQGTIGKIVNIVHDEVLVETVEKNAEYIKEAINDSMTQGFLDVFPGGITRDITAVGKGNNWAEAKA